MDKNSLEDAQKMAKHIFASGFEQVQRGRNNWVFNKGDLILVIPRHERVKGYGVRVAAIKKLASASIPVPQIVDYASCSGEFPEYLVTKKVEGINVDLAKLTPYERERVHHSSGEILFRIHAISSEYYGRFDENLQANLTSWRQFTDGFFEESLRRLRKTPVLWNKYGELLIKEYRTGGNLIDAFCNPRFLHSDFHLNNLLFKDLKVAAVLDTDMVTSGDPAWDSGHYCHTFNVDRASGVRAFKKGYQMQSDSEREMLYSVIIWTKKIASQAIDRPEALKETIPELEKILRREI